MFPRQIAVVAVVAALAGCSATPAPVPTPESIPAATTCDTLTDVLTVLYNADISLRDGRSSQQEHNGAMYLAARILSRIQVEPSGGLEDPVRRLQAAAPLPSPSLGNKDGSFDADSAAWGDALSDASDACLAAGSEVATFAWTGG
jgi:hypothetical protein